MSCDLPGFYYDPDKKKYFAITPGTSGSVFLSAGDARLRSAQVKKSVKSGPTVDLSQRMALQEADVKSPTGLTFREDFVKARLTSTRFRKSLKIDVSDYMGNEVDDYRCDYMFAEPDVDAYYAIWYEPDGTSVLGRISLIKIMRLMSGATSSTNSKSLRPKILNCFPPGAKITDVHSFSNEEMNFIICLSVRMESRTRKYCTSLSLQLQEQEVDTSSPPSPARGLRDQETRMNFEFPGVYHSCAAAANRFAIGGQKHVKIFTSSSGRQNTIFQGFMNYTSQSASSKVTGLRFSSVGSSSDIILAATNKGFVHTFDLRTPSECSKTRVTRCTINQMKQYDDNKWLMSGHENTLVMIDQRSMKSPFLSFDGHVNSCHKTAICLNDVMRTVSMPGDDCITRFWSLGSGKLVGDASLPPHVQPVVGSASHTWLLQNPLSTHQTSLLSTYNQELMLSF